MNIRILLASFLLVGCSRFLVPEQPDIEDLLERSRDLIASQEYETAMSVAVEALSKAEVSHDLAMKANALCTVSLIDLMATRDSQSWENACAAEKIAREEHLYQPLCESLIIKGRVCSYAEISSDYNRNDEALDYLTEAYNVSLDQNLTKEHIASCYHLSEVYVNKNRWNETLVPEWYQKAEEYLGEGERLAEESSQEELIRKSIPCRIRLYRQGGEIEEAIEYCQRFLKMTDSTDWSTKAQIFDQLTSLFGDREDPEKVLENHRNYVYAMQLYMRQKADARLQDLENQYEYLVKQRQIEKTHHFMLIFAILLAMSIFLIWQSLRYNRKISSQKAALEEADKSKKILLEAISSDLVDVSSLSSANEMMELVRNSRSMDEQEIRQSVEKLVEGSASLSNEVSSYFYKLILHRKKAVELSGLTERELEVLRLSARGMSASQIADVLHISSRTVTNHKQNIYLKMGVNSTPEMVFKAREAGLL